LGFVRNGTLTRNCGCCSILRRRSAHGNNRKSRDRARGVAMNRASLIASWGLSLQPFCFPVLDVSLMRSASQEICPQRRCPQTATISRQNLARCRSSTKTSTRTRSRIHPQFHLERSRLLRRRLVRRRLHEASDRDELAP
jgi:hypothetical protein